MSASAPTAGTQPGVGSVASQTNGINDPDAHARKPSVVITASGATGPNGAPITPNARPKISFGSMAGPPGSSPASTNAVPFSSQTSTLPPSKSDNPRITEPSQSPSPIPQPMASGGRPPNLPMASGNGLSFGSMGMDNSETNRHTLTQGSYAPQLRREPSQQGQSDISGNDMRNTGYMPQSGRGRGGPHQFSGHSPAQNYRQLPTVRGQQSPYQGQGQMGNPNFRRNSPAMMHAQPHMPQGGPASSSQMQYGGYQQHLGGHQANMYGMPSQFDPYAAGYYQPYYPQGYPGASSSPRPQHYPQPYGGPPSQMQSPYRPPSMSRSASQLSDRPASSLSSRPQGSAVSALHGQSAGVTPSTPAASPATSSNFKIPPRTKSKAIVIKNAEGKEISFEKKVSQAPAPAQASPAIVSSSNPSKAPPAPAQTPVATSTSPSPPNDIKTSTKSSDEIKSGFQEQVKKQLEAQREHERKLKVNDTKDSTPVQLPQKAMGAEPVVSEPELVEPVKHSEDTAKMTDPAVQSSEQHDDADVAKPSAEEDAARIKREEDERLEREIAEMEAAEKEEEERERKFQEKKAKELAEKKARDAAGPSEDELKRLEREAEEREIAREKAQEAGGNAEKSRGDRDLFASLKKPTLGPGSTGAPAESEPQPEASTDSAAPSDIESSKHAPGKPRPTQLKLGSEKAAEPDQPTATMRSLQSARMLDSSKETVSYPAGIKAPQLADNSATAGHAGKLYDREFLMQFQAILKGKPTVDWDQKVKETLSDGDGASNRGGQGRAPSNASGRQPSSRGQQTPSFGGVMGSFTGGARTLPPNTTSEQRFQASAQGGRAPSNNPMAGFGGRGGFPMGAPMSRTNSMQAMAQPSPRSNTRGKGGSRRGGDRAMSRREEESAHKTMPLTAGQEVKSLEKSSSGWTARSLGAAGGASSVGLDGMMAPDMVQRKVKAALNKMTPEKFDKISDEIVNIANQSEKEADGRTLRQVIQLTFEKACDEAHWAGMYAKFCLKMLTTMSEGIVDETLMGRDEKPLSGGALFRKYLLNRCQEEFERGWQANLPEPAEGATEEAALLSDEYYVAAAAKRRGLGLIQFIGELYKLGMLTYKIMHSCVKKLLDFEGAPDEATIESLCKLLRTIGHQMDNANPTAHGMVDVYILRINDILTKNQNMPSRPRFMLMDILDARKSGWTAAQAKGPKTIQEIHAEAEAAAAAQEAERAKQSQRGGGRMHDRGYGNQGMPPPPQDYQRTQVGVSDLRWLQSRGSQPRQPSQGLGPSLGPGSSLFAGRSASGRKMPASDSSATPSRLNTPTTAKRDEKDEATTPSTNAFSALAALEGENTEASTTSPPGSTKGSPALSKGKPAMSIDGTVSDSKDGSNDAGS